MWSYFSNDKPNEQKEEKKCMLIAKSEIANFPSQIIKPSEQTRYENLTNDETKICEYLSTTYESQISNFQFWTDDIIPRFVTDTYYIKNYEKRLELTKTRFEQYIKHRNDFHFDNILTLPSLNTDKHKQIIKENTEIFEMYYHGIDKEGHPCIWDNGKASGQSDKINKLFGNDNYERASYYRCRFKRMEKNLMLKLNNYYNSKISKAVMVFDLKNVSLSGLQQSRSFHQWNMRSSSELFPETMHKIFVINSPWAFQMIWKVCCQFLDEITVEKTKILGSDYMKEMKKYIDIDMIPKEFGGKGIWEPRPGDVPVDFPFQMDDMKTMEKDEEKKIENENDNNEKKEYVYKNIDYDNNKIICINENGKDITLELPVDKNILDKIKICIEKQENEKNKVIITVCVIKKEEKVTEMVLDANIVDNNTESK